MTVERLSPTLSVIVHVRGGERRLAECLASLGAQTLPAIEVILTGRPPAVPLPDERFTVVAADAGDAGAARNLGVARARGRYLAFADGDAAVPPDAFERLVRTLEATGSDLACGQTAGVDTAPGDRLGTHVTREPALLRDGTATGKVFRRAFWDEHRLAFPEGLGEDFPVTVRALVLARSVDVLGDVALPAGGRRERAAAPRRLAALLELAAFIGERAPGLREHWDALVTADPALGAVLDRAHEGPGALAGLVPGLARLHPAAVRGLPALRRLQLHLAVRGMAEELAALHRFAETELRHRGVVRRGPPWRRRWYVDYPLRRDRRLPRHLFDAEQDLLLVAGVDDVRHAGGRLTVAGHAYISHLASRGSRIELWLQRGRRRIGLPLRRVARPDVTADSRQSAVCHDDSGFVTEIDPAALPHGRWALHARVTARGVTREGRVPGGRHAGERVFAAGGVTVTLTRDGGLTLQPGDPAGPPDPGGDRVTEVRWGAGHELLLSGVGESGADRIVLRSGLREHSWPMRWTGTRWTAAIGRTEDGLPLRSGTWRVLAGGEPVRLSPELVADLPAAHTTPVHEISIRTTRAAELRLVVRPALGPDERGPYATRRRRARRRRGRLRNAALFDSYGGGQYSCNPRAISEELARRRPDMELIWVTRDGQFTVPPGVRTVLYGSREHEEALHTSRFVVANRRTQPGWYRKRPGQRFVQCWHGTPLKRLGRDVAGMPYAQRFPEEEWRRHVVMWDALISPNPFSTPILCRAFGYTGEVLETGYPRNDALFRPERREQARRRLGIPEGRRAILYAPTWRDDELAGSGPVAPPLDVGRLAAALGDGDVVLLRPHYLVADRMTAPRGVRDVSRFPDMADLLAAADLLITDYSSAMFDFACTGRPMVFFTPDLERYRDEVRGFYFDFEAEAPGPILRATDEVVEVLKHGDFTAYKARYEEFAAKFCPWDDGRASARVVDWMLA
ncbi:hypothetical protein TBS_26240 [Thermobispora bispora]|uniref:CDP-glycerol glycerophosphotransferase family protein n=1 Tax=Thermobispora bispora TaxID=2006 RepID=UPI0030E86C1A